MRQRPRYPAGLNPRRARCPPLPSPVALRCYCCDKQAPCADWAVHCDAKSGVAQWDSMRARIQQKQVRESRANNVRLPRSVRVPPPHLAAASTQHS